VTLLEEAVELPDRFDIDGRLIAGFLVLRVIRVLR
jgi:hypothetical protein